MKVKEFRQNYIKDVRIKTLINNKSHQEAKEFYIIYKGEVKESFRFYTERQKKNTA